MGVVPLQPVLGHNVQGDGENEQRDDDVKANFDTERGAEGVRQRQADAV